ncbi:hypothetical protein GUJ93_ZPchr0001g29415 [Zizania palustris]|uniref:Cullin N-terminal domain-containing protein n=1 Tax=Zizania palustris TaxID=103762 RepID=A0A8J5V1Q3_ZIZPA|nr:hypothetical protein GUJ93_ZPchr0001g29415 [Zizania palustris]
MNDHLSFEDGWKVLEQGIMKCSKILEDCPAGRPTVAEYMNYYHCVYRMSVQKNQYCQEMYNGYKTTLADCVRAMVFSNFNNEISDALLMLVKETMEKETKRLIHYLCISEEESSNLCLKAVSAPLMQTYEKEKHVGDQVLLQTYKTVEEELLAKYSSLTIDSGMDDSSLNYMEQ